MNKARFGILAVVYLLLVGSHPAYSAADELPRVRNGIDVLREQNFAPLANKRVGLITNHTGLAADGTTTIDLLHQSSSVQLVALFSPEHGIRGILERKVDSTVDEKTGLPIHSLYGETRRPTAEMLRGIDVLVFDIQDIGARFYTFASTMANCMEEAAKAGIPYYVLDRPNPIGGIRVAGPILDGDKTSFIGYMEMPVRHGMTMGELARLFNAENKIGADLRVIEMKGWRRSYYFSDTGQLWVNPSPNMRSLTAAIFYPGVCLVEATNLSVGRGTAKPFELLGAPWVDPWRLAEALNAADLPGVEFVPIRFTPDASRHKGVPCGGVSLVLTDLEEFDSLLTGMTLVSVIYRLYPKQFTMDKVLRLLGNEKALELLKAGRAPAEVLKAGQARMREFMAKRKRALLYGAAAEPGEGN
jgi:uncharacterized protein YbbC (DUF1343 family)